MNIFNFVIGFLVGLFLMALYLTIESESKQKKWEEILKEALETMKKQSAFINKLLEEKYKKNE